MTTHGLPAWPWTEEVIEALPRPEALLLEGMRRWADATRRGHAALPALRLPFIAEGAGLAASALDALLLAGHGRFALAQLLEPRLTPDEAALLLALALAQRGPRREALAAMLRLLSPAEACAALGPATRAGTCLRRAGLLMRNPLR